LGGTIYGPYNHQKRKYRALFVRGADLAKAIPVFDNYLPKSHKRDQFSAWLEHERVRVLWQK
jgi:hypothetical protein